ncbi:MAG: right-handed parallel beta-helix repeat-containing protein, partial [Acidobacteriota bacterium]|nr:right-handed parallel beta-helix repeat-containing protein [Acidobacteriota bacterium]
MRQPVEKLSLAARCLSPRLVARVTARRSSAQRIRKILSFLAPLLVVVFVSGAHEVRAQIAVDSVSGVTGPSSNQTTQTWSHTVGAGSNRILIVGVSFKNGAANVNSITYGGTALVSIGSRTDAGTNTKIEIWKLVAPASGTANIVVTLSAAKRIVAGSVSFTGVDQTTPNGAFASNVGSNNTPTVNVASAVGELVIDTLATQGDASPATVSVGQTQRWNRTTGANDGNEVLGGGSTKPGAATVTMSWTLGQGQAWSIGAIALKPAPLGPTYSVSGTVFEDVNYGGGSGRSLASSSGSARSNARVELYDAIGNFVSSTTTNGSGVYTFSGLIAGSYTVRVVNSTVTSSRTGYVATLIPVQTFRTDATTGNAVADTNRVGGEVPNKADAASNTTNATLASLTTASTTAQSITPAIVSIANITGVDFGFNFDTVVNINDAGQGSLRQFITNSNALGNGGLAQAGLTFGEENTIFMISDGLAHSGLRAGLANQLTGGVAIITPASLLPAITDASTSINGTTQTTDVGNTNSGTLGVGGQVGIDNLSLSTVARPEIQVVDNSGVLIGIDVQANNVTIRGLAIYGFGTSANTDGHANIRIGNNFTGTLITENVLGSTATSFTDPGAATRSIGDNIRSQGGDNGIVRNNLIGFSQGKGFGVESTSTGWLIENNEIRGNAITNSFLDGIDIENSSGGATVRGNLIRDNEGVGVDSYLGSGTSVIVNNTIINNGFGPNANVETAGVRLFGVGNTVDRNIITANAGAGVAVTSNSTGNTITRNSIYANGPVTGQIGIDLFKATDDITKGTAPFVTPNDAGDVDVGGNDLFNFPVLTTAVLSGGNLTLSGYARPGSAIEFFIAEVDPSGFGEGKTYKVTLTEGSGADTDATTGTYTNPVNGLNQGTDTTNKFSFTIPTPSGVSAGTILTATGTLGGNTSEFSGNVTVTAAPPDMTITKSHSGNFTQGQVGAQYTITATNSGGLSTNGSTVTVTDTLPAGLTPTGPIGLVSGWTCGIASQTLTCTRSDVLAAGSSYPAITLTVNVANNAAASVTNSVSVSGGGQTNTANDTATDPTTINQLPDMTITKSHSGNFTQGQVGAQYTITATNSGAASTNGSTVTVTDTLPAGLTPTGPIGLVSGWTCGIASQTLTCTRSDVLAAGLSYPTITVTVNVANNAPASVTNSVSVSGGGQIITTNDTATDPTTINQLPDMTITKSHTGNFTQGQVGATYTITATNSGAAATTGTAVNVTDTLPAGLTATGISGAAPWS